MGDNNRTRLEHEGAVGDPRPPEPPSPHGSDYSVGKYLTDHLFDCTDCN